jgi:hypothetical protein
MKTRFIVMNNNAGAFVDVLPTILARQVEFMEDEGTLVQGIQVKTSLDGFTNINVFSFGSEPVQIPNMLRWPALGPILATLAQGLTGAFKV